jgi:hypothetical protein
MSEKIAFSVGIFSGFCGIVNLPQTQKEVLQMQRRKTYASL